MIYFFRFVFFFARVVGVGVVGVDAGRRDPVGIGVWVIRARARWCAFGFGSICVVLFTHTYTYVWVIRKIERLD